MPRDTLRAASLIEHHAAGILQPAYVLNTATKYQLGSVPFAMASPSESIRRRPPRSSASANGCAEAAAGATEGQQGGNGDEANISDVARLDTAESPVGEAQEGTTGAASDLDCPVCLELLWRPAGFPKCGHCVCEQCMRRSVHAALKRAGSSGSRVDRGAGAGGAAAEVRAAAAPVPAGDGYPGAGAWASRPRGLGGASTRLRDLVVECPMCRSAVSALDVARAPVIRALDAALQRLCTEEERAERKREAEAVTASSQFVAGERSLDAALEVEERESHTRNGNAAACDRVAAAARKMAIVCFISLVIWGAVVLIAAWGFSDGVRDACTYPQERCGLAQGNGGDLAVARSDSSAQGADPGVASGPRPEGFAAFLAAASDVFTGDGGGTLDVWAPLRFIIDTDRYLAEALLATVSNTNAGTSTSS